MQKVKSGLLYFLVLVYISGAIGFVLNPHFFAPFTPYTLLFTCFVFLIFQPITNKMYLFSFLSLAFIGYGCELVGVKTGLIFGNYYYGNALGVKLFNVPLVISLNWALLINIGILISIYFTNNKFLVSLIAAILITGVDFIIEQVAANLDFWYFDTNIAGIQNYVAWFVITFLASYFFQDYLKKGLKHIAFIIFLLQIYFFGLIYIVKLFNFTAS